MQNQIQSNKFMGQSNIVIIFQPNLFLAPDGPYPNPAGQA